MRYANCTSLLLILCAKTAIGAPPAAECPDGSIASITIENHSIFDTSDPRIPRHLRLAYNVANTLHARTRASVIRRDLTIRQGDCFDPDRVAESERLLRDNQFLASARIHRTTRPDGDHDLVVETRDEWSTQLDIRASLDGGLSFEGASLREMNFLGYGQSVELFYFDYDANREYGVGYHTHQLGGRQWHLGGAIGRTRTGPLAYQTLAYPFREESGRWAFREEIRRLDRYFDYLITDGDTEAHLLRPARTRAFDLAVLHRLGEPGRRQTTLGAAINYTDLTFPGGDDAVELIEGDAYDSPLPANSALLAPIRRQTDPFSSLRALILLGQRRVTWIKLQGFDTMRGEQDIRIGTEAGLALGRSITAGAGPHHLFGALDLYNAIGSDRFLLTTRVRGDLRRDLSAGAPFGWSDIFGEVEALAYWRPDPEGRQTFVLRATGTGGWETRTPFQLTLGGDYGLRGYPRESLPGGRRLIFSLEDRITFDGPLREIMDLGATVFVDFGRTWPGDAPFGIDSGWRASAGVGLRNSIPSGGRRTYRFDLAFPIGPGTEWRDLRLILSVGELIGVTPNPRRQRIEELQRLTSRNPFYFPD